MLMYVINTILKIIHRNSSIMFIIDSNAIEEVAKTMVSWPEERNWNSKCKDQRFRSLFGASSGVAAHVWNRVMPSVNKRTHPKHLLWALVFLKVYSTEEVHCSIVGWPDVQTFRYWSWYYIARVAALKEELIQLGFRFRGLEDGIANTNCFISV